MKAITAAQVDNVDLYERYIRQNNHLLFFKVFGAMMTIETYRGFRASHAHPYSGCLLLLSGFSGALLFACMFLSGFKSPMGIILLGFLMVAMVTEISLFRRTLTEIKNGYESSSKIK